MDQIERLVTPKLSRDVLKLLHQRGWSAERVARTIRGSREFVRRVESAAQSLSERDLRALARANRTGVTRLLFDAMGPAMLKSHLRGLYESTRQVVESCETRRADTRAPTRKRASTTTKAA